MQDLSLLRTKYFCWKLMQAVFYFVIPGNLQLQVGILLQIRNPALPCNYCYSCGCLQRKSEIPDKHWAGENGFRTMSVWCELGSAASCRRGCTAPTVFCCSFKMCSPETRKESNMLMSTSEGLLSSQRKAMKLLRCGMEISC